MPANRITRPMLLTAMLCAVGLVGAASAQDRTIKVFAPTPQQLSASDTSSSTVKQYEARRIQSGVYDRASDRNRPFYGQAWSEDWGSVQVAVSGEPVFVPRGGGEAFVPDRRPAIEIVMHNGDRENPRGMSDVWYGLGAESTDVISGFTDQDIPLRGPNGIPDAFDYLMSRLNMHYDAGFRRMILHLPAGAVDSTHMDSAQYWTMEDWRRKWFWLEVRRWITQKELDGDPVSLGVYLGWKTHDPTRFDMVGAVAPDMSDEQHVEWMHQNIYPWVRLGFKEFWFDASSSHRPISETSSVRQRDVLGSLRHSPTWGPVARFCGEAVPGIGRLIDHRLDEVAIRQTGWMAIPLYLESRFGDQLGQSPITPFFDPGTTEATCWIRNSNRTGADGEPGRWQDYPIAHYERLRQHGMVFRAQESRMDDNDYKSYVTAEFVQRLLGFGRITAPVDFDGDGLIEIERGSNFPYAGEDWDKFFQAAMTTIRGGGGSGYFAGDINDDGLFDMGDIVLFRGFLDDYLDGLDRGEPVITPLDLGDPWWVPVSGAR